MCSTTGLSPGELLDQVEELTAALSGVVLNGQVDDEDVRAGLARLVRLERRVAGAKLRWIAEADRREAHVGHARDTVELVALVCGLSRGEAVGQTETAAVLDRLPKTAEQMTQGEVGADRAREAARTLHKLEELAEANPKEQVQLEEAAAMLDDLVARDGQTTSRRQLRRACDEIAHRATPRALRDREQKAWRERGVWVGPAGPDRLPRIEGDLDVAGAAVVTAALDAHAAKRSADDRRSLRQRRADALVEVCRQALDHGQLPQVAGGHPHVLVLTTRDTLDGSPGAPPAIIDGLGPVSSATARLLACEGQVTEIVVDLHGRPLQVNETGKPTRAQRLAVIARDQACIGCGAPAARCQLHHIVWRSHDGATVVENLCLLCWACHHAVHHDHWQITTAPDGRYRAHPPELAHPRQRT